jgi:hypothetical protein
VSVESDAGTFYRVSDVVLTEEEMNVNYGAEPAVLIIDEIYDNGWEMNGIEIQMVFNDIGAIGAFGDRVLCAITDNYEFSALGVVCPKSGIYFHSSHNGASFKLYNCTKFPSTKLMDKKYLPMDDITAAVLAALPTWEGGSY